jgi:hypothetical protein
VQNTAEQLRPNSHELNQEHRVLTDTISWSAEMLNGSMRTPTFEFTPDGNDLYGEDGGSLTKVFDDSVEHAMLVAKARPDLIFGVRRAIIERGELDDMLDMANGGPNTMVVISDYPPELMANTESKGGYNGARKQTMLRVIMRRNGKLYMASQSLDGSDRQALEAVAASINQTVEDGELLRQRKKLDLPEAWQNRLLDNMTQAYDSALAEQHGGKWHAGIRQPEEHRTVNTYEFATQQHDLIDWFSKAKLRDPKGAESLRYQLAAAMTARYERRDELASLQPATVRNFLGATAITPPNQLLLEIQTATKNAKDRGIIFSACGITESGSSATKEQLQQLGYGNTETEDTDTDKLGSLTFTCSKGHSNRRQRNSLIDNCKTCGISVRCKPEPKEQQKAVDRRRKVALRLLASV